jgi:hypothetical protein
VPILDLQTRMRQLGEIRIGHVVDTGKISKKTDKPIMRPAKLDKFRFTSASRPILEQIAELYGGTVQPWTPANGGPTEWEVFSEADRVPVIIPPMNNVIDAWYEQYKGSRCVRRCDGEIEQKSDKSCMCDPDNRECTITVRLNVMLRDVKGLGVWLLTSHGRTAASELPPMAKALLRAGGEIDGWLTVEEKKVPLEDGTTARFMVPKLDVDLSPGELYAGAGRGPALQSGQRAAVEQPERTAIEAPAQGTAVPVDQLAGQVTAVEQCDSLDRLTVLLQEAIAAYRADNIKGLPRPLQAAFVNARGLLTSADEAGEAGSAVAPPADLEALWSQIVAAWPGDKTSDIEDAFAQHYQGLHPSSADEAQLAEFLADLKAGRIKQTDEVPF